MLLDLRACFETLNGNTDIWIQFLKYVNVSTHIYILHWGMPWRGMCFVSRGSLEAPQKGPRGWRVDCFFKHHETFTRVCGDLPSRPRITLSSQAPYTRSASGGLTWPRALGIQVQPPQFTPGSHMLTTRCCRPGFNICLFLLSSQSQIHRCEM